MTHQAILQATAKSYDTKTTFQIEDLLEILSKVGCVFPMVIWPEFRPGQYRDDGQWDDAYHIR